MIIYLLFFLFLIACSILGNLKLFTKNLFVKSIIVVWLPVLILILLSTIKSNSVGVDTAEYFEKYGRSSAMEIGIALEWLNSYEIGFRLMFVIFAKIGLPFKIFQLVLYSIIYTLLGIVVMRESKYPVLSFLIFALWSFMIFNFSGLRQGFADTVSVFSLFLVFRKRNKIWKNILNTIVSLSLLGIAISFHSSSIAFVAAFVLFGIKKLVPEYFRKITICLVVMLPIVYFLSPELYQYFFYLAKKNYYLPTERSNTGGLLIVYSLILIFALTFSRENIISNRTNSLFDNVANKLFRQKSNRSKETVGTKQVNDFTELLIAVFCIGVIIESFSSVSYTITRLSNPFLMTSIIMIPNIIEKNDSKALRIFAEVGVVLLFALIFYVDNYSINYLNCFPYSF